MKRKIIQSLSVAAMAVCLAASAMSVKSVSAQVSEPRELYNNDDFYVRHYLYYTNGAMVSLNNLVGDSYNFDDDSEFNKKIRSLASKFIPGVYYDDTDALRTEAGADDNAKLTSIYRMPSQKMQILTNYSDEELKEKGLLPTDDVVYDQSSGTYVDSSSISQNVIDSEEATTSELVQAASYLIGKDYYTLPRTIIFETARGGLGPRGTLHVNQASWFKAYNGMTKDSNSMLKSDLIMMLSKIYNGVQPSSAIVVDDLSFRRGEVWATVNPSQKMESSKAESYYSNGSAGMDYYGSSEDVYGGDSDLKDPHTWKGETHKGVQFQGDYYVYYDPNVYELYLTQAINAGVISKTDLSEKYRSIYTDKGSTSWRSGEVYLAETLPKKVLGNSIDVRYSGSKLKIEPNAPEYFGDKEEMTMLEALRLIEAYMRNNDDNMSKTEESIVRYKFGLNILSYLSEDDQSTVTYLIAKGILDGGNNSLTAMLDKDATISRLFPILYRVANKNARIDFNTIQLTDSETYWASKDFSANDISVFETDDPIIHETGDVELVTNKSTKSASASSRDILLASSSSGQSNPFVLKASAAETVKKYRITKYFDTKSVYRISNTSIADLVSASDATLSKYSIVSIKKISKDDKDAYEYNGKKRDIYKVVFEVSATKQSAALKAVEQKYSVMSDIDKYKKTISGVTSIEKNGTKTTLVSQTSLKQSFSNITVLEDKILMNNVTGTLAYFSYDSKKSIVGSQVIDSGYAGVVKAGDEVYYNLESLLPLLSSAYVDTIGPQISIVVTDIEHTHNISISTSLTSAGDYPLKAQYLRVYQSASPDTEGDDHYGFTCIANSDTKKAISGEDYDVSYLVKLNSLSTAANKLTKSFSVNYNGTVMSGTIIVDLQYVVPDAGNFPNWLEQHIFPSDTMTYQQAAQIMTTPPDKLGELQGFNTTTSSMTSVEKSALNAWWYSNYGMSNALCNFIFGTEGIVYVHSGYVCPSVTVLIDNVSNKSFEEWCGKDKTKARNNRDAILDQIFHDFSLGASYVRYNGGNSKNIWHNFYQMDSSNPDYTNMGFPSGNKQITNTIYAARRFEIYCQPGKKTLKKNKLGKQASEESLKTYGMRYAVSASGCIYETLDTLGTAQHPMFTYSYNSKEGEPTTLNTLKLNSRSSEQLVPSTNNIIYLNDKTVRYGGSASTKNLTYYTVYQSSLYNASGLLDPKTVTLKLEKDTVTSLKNQKVVYYPSCVSGNTGCRLDSQGFADIYKTKYSAMFNEIDTYPGDSFVQSMVKSADSNLFFDPSTISQNKSLMEKIFGTKPVYLYTDKGNTSDLGIPGMIYKWNGSKLTKCTSSTITMLCDGKTLIYAIPRFFAPGDSFYFQKNSSGNIIMGMDALSKALNYLQFDLTSLNNQLIESYLNSQTGVKSINKLDNGSTVIIGDTVWIKKGAWLQSKPIYAPKNIKSVIAGKSIDMMPFANEKFNGMSVVVQGQQYPLAAYIKKMTLGGKVGSKKQLKRGVIYRNGNTIMVRKADKVSKATKSTSAWYLSLRAQFDDSLMVRPIDSTDRNFTLVSHCDSGLISSANYPFFDQTASWDHSNKNKFSVSQTRFKPSAHFVAAKEAFMKEFAATLAKDSWNYIWVVIMILCCYLLVMSWFAFCVLTMGVGRAGFEALTLPDMRGGKKGIDLIKFATFGLYSLDRPLSLGRTVIVSFCCCIIIVTILTLIF